jgi:hypothetical protein
MTPLVAPRPVLPDEASSRSILYHMWSRPENFQPLLYIMRKRLAKQERSRSANGTRKYWFD